VEKGDRLAATANGQVEPLPAAIRVLAILMCEAQPGSPGILLGGRSLTDPRKTWKIVC
jgi:hypothetical protein